MWHVVGLVITKNTRLLNFFLFLNYLTQSKSHFSYPIPHHKSLTVLVLIGSTSRKWCTGFRCTLKTIFWPSLLVLLKIRSLKRGAFLLFFFVWRPSHELKSNFFAKTFKLDDRVSICSDDDAAAAVIIPLSRREPWSCGYERRLMFQRSWVQIQAPYTGWTFLHFFVVKIVMCVWNDKNRLKEAGIGPFLIIPLSTCRRMKSFNCKIWCIRYG